MIPMVYGRTKTTFVELELQLLIKVKCEYDVSVFHVSNHVDRERCVHVAIQCM